MKLNRNTYRASSAILSIATVKKDHNWELYDLKTEVECEK